LLENNTNLFKNIGIIPARGGSKGIPQKNIVRLNGLPLINYTISAGLKSKYLSKVVVSSDDDKILKISKKAGADVLKRPAHLAKDSTHINEAITDVIENLSQNNENFDLAVVLQPTSPLRNFKHIDDAFELLYNSKRTSLISVYELGVFPNKCFTINEKGFLNGLVDNDKPFANRQDLPMTFMPNGAIYIFKIKDYIENNFSFPIKQIVPFIMSKSDSIDIDNYGDIDKVAEMLNKNEEK